MNWDDVVRIRSVTAMRVTETVSTGANFRDELYLQMRDKAAKCLVLCKTLNLWPGGQSPRLALLLFCFIF